MIECNNFFECLPNFGLKGNQFQLVIMQFIILILIPVGLLKQCIVTWQKTVTFFNHTDREGMPRIAWKSFPITNAHTLS